MGWKRAVGWRTPSAKTIVFGRKGSRQRKSAESGCGAGCLGVLAIGAAGGLLTRCVQAADQASAGGIMAVIVIIIVVIVGGRYLWGNRGRTPEAVDEATEARFAEQRAAAEAWRASHPEAGFQSTASAATQQQGQSSAHGSVRSAPRGASPAHAPPPRHAAQPAGWSAPPSMAVVSRSPAPRAEPPRFIVDEPVVVAGRSILRPLTYVAAPGRGDDDAGTIDPYLPVGNAARALPLPYWPRYVHADPDQRARYLDWMASGRHDGSIEVGYAFIFFYGLERRVLIDGADADAATAEVRRLLGLFGHNNSFRSYASSFLAFAPLRNADRLRSFGEADVTAHLYPLVAESSTALAAVAAWYHLHGRPLPATYAGLIARDSEDAKRGAVITRSAAELWDLFAIRYQEAFGQGMITEANKRPLTIEYRPASPSLLSNKRDLRVAIPDVVGRTSQFRKLVALWNDCVDDLRRANSKKRGGAVLDADAWSALPSELRAEYDHPDQDKWDRAITAMPVLETFHLASAQQLATLIGLPVTAKLGVAQMKRIASRAADVGYAVEPDSRIRGRAADATAELLVWRAPNAKLPDVQTYGAVTGMLSLAMKIAMADGVFAPEEQTIVNAFLTELFTLDEDMRTRVEAMKQLMARSPAQLGAVAKALRESRTSAELAKIGAVLVAIAAADGSIAEPEERALRSLYKSLGLSTADLTGAITRTGARFERDVVVEVQSSTPGRGGVPIPRPPTDGLRLDHAAIAAIVADTKDVAAMLAEVFDAEDDDGTTPSPSATPAPVRAAVASAAPRTSEATRSLAQGLDVRYHGVLEELLARPSWPVGDVRQLAERHRLMPGAILDTINGWSDDALGDFLIEDAGDWKVNVALARARQ